MSSDSPSDVENPAESPDVEPSASAQLKNKFNAETIAEALSLVGGGVGVGPPPNGHGMRPSFQLANIPKAITAMKVKIIITLK